MSDLTYQPSGKGGAALLPMLLAGAVVGVAIALPYSKVVGYLFRTAHGKIHGFGDLLGWGLLLLATWVLGAGGAGMIVGGVASGVGRALKCRTGASVGLELVALGLAAVGLYAYYDGWVLQAQGRSVLELLPPDQIKAYLDEHLADRETSGKVMAYVAYAIEALFYYGGIKLSLERLERPFCEACQRWTTRHEAAAHFTLPDVREALEVQLLAGRVEPLVALGPAHMGPERCLAVDLDVCDGCAGSSYLTVREVKNPIQPEEGALQTAKSLYALTSPDGIVGTMAEGAKEEANEEELVTRLRVDEAFVRSVLPEKP